MNFGKINYWSFFRFPSLVRLHSSCLPALEAIEDLACKEVTLNKLLRIICMQSLVSSGLKPKLVELYRCVCNLLLRAVDPADPDPGGKHFKVKKLKFA